MRWHLTPKASGSLNPGEFIQADQCYLISAGPDTSSYLSPPPAGPGSGTPPLWQIQMVSVTARKNRRWKNETSRSLEDEREALRDSDRLRQTCGKSALCQLRSILRLVPGRRRGEAINYYCGSPFWSWRLYLMHISSATITEAANYWHFRLLIWIIRDVSNLGR